MDPEQQGIITTAEDIEGKAAAVDRCFLALHNYCAQNKVEFKVFPHPPAGTPDAPIFQTSILFKGNTYVARAYKKQHSKDLAAKRAMESLGKT